VKVRKRISRLLDLALAIGIIFVPVREEVRRGF
jgi:hypothetical protein